MNNLFTDKHQIRQFDTFRLVYLLVFIITFAATEFGRFVYRPYIYQNHIYDFSLADSIGNLGGIVVQIFFGLFILNSNIKQGIRLVLFFCMGYILYEIVQPVLPRGVFDWKDVFGTLIGGLAGMGLFLLIHRMNRVNRVFFRLNSINDEK